MRPSDDAPALDLEWRIGGAAVALFVVFVGWAALRPRAAPAQRAAVTEAAPIRGTPMRAPAAPVAAAPAADPPPEPVAPAASTQAVSADPSPADVPPAPPEARTFTAGAPSATTPGAATSLPAASASAPEPSKAADPAAAAKEGEPAKVTIAFLAGFLPFTTQYEYDDDGKVKSEKRVEDPVPKEVRALSGRRVSIEGFMVPYDFADGKCTKFMISMMPPGCCFGCAAQPNNWIEVSMKQGEKASCADRAQIVAVVGVLTVHRVDDQGTPLYTMTGESVRESAEEPK